jgi:hypothetical protein
LVACKRRLQHQPPSRRDQPPSGMSSPIG